VCLDKVKNVISDFLIKRSDIFNLLIALVNYLLEIDKIMLFFVDRKYVIEIIFCGSLFRHHYQEIPDIVMTL
jgi:hypothetical protein